MRTRRLKNIKILPENVEEKCGMLKTIFVPIVVGALGKEPLRLKGNLKGI